MTAKFVGLWLLLAFASAPGRLLGQASGPPEPAVAYVTGGLGVGSLGLAWLLGVSVHPGAGLLLFRYAGTTEVDLFEPSDQIQEVAFLGGVRATGSQAWVSVAAGPGVAWATTYGVCREPTGWFACASWDVNRQVRAGVAYDLTLGWSASGTVGVSLSVLGNVSDRRSFHALTANVHLGRLR